MTKIDRRAQVSSVIAAYYEAIRTGDVDAWVGIHATDATVFDPVDGDPGDGVEDLRRVFVLRWGDLNGIAEDCVLPVADGAAVKWSASRSDATAGSTVGIDVFEIDADGLIRTMWGYREDAEWRDRVMPVWK